MKRLDTLEELEHLLSEDPDNIEARLALVERYATASAPEAVARRFEHIRWLVEHAPESASPWMFIDARRYPEHWSAVREVWLKKCHEFPTDGRILSHAAGFLMLGEPETSISLLESKLRLGAPTCDDYAALSTAWTYRWLFAKDGDERQQHASTALTVCMQACLLERHQSLARLVATMRAACRSRDYSFSTGLAARIEESIATTPQTVAREESERYLAYCRASHGLAAIATDDIDTAVTCLESMSSSDARYGVAISAAPDFLLADELLRRVQTAIVVEYLRAIRPRWSSPSRIDAWLDELQRGQAVGLNDTQLG